MKRVPIRILHVIPTLGHGGAERQLSSLVAQSDPKQFRHFVTCLKSPAPFAHTVLNSGHSFSNFELNNKYPWFRAARSIRGIVRGFKPHLLHSWLFDAHMSVRLATLFDRKPPVIISLQNADYDARVIEQARWPKWKMEGKRRLERVLGQSAHQYYVACSESVRESAQKELAIPDHRICTIFNSVDEGPFDNVDFDSNAFKEECSIPTDAFLYVNVARLDPQKGQFYLFSAFAKVLQRVTRAFLLIVGNGGLRPYLENEADRLGIRKRVCFLESYTPITQVLRSSDVFVFPSLFEGLAIAPLEAMYAGLPVIATSLSVIEEVISNGSTGLLVPPKSIDALSSAMIELHDNQLKRAQLAQAGRRVVQARFSLRGATLPQWQSLYSRLSTDLSAEIQ